MAVNKRSLFEKLKRAKAANFTTRMAWEQMFPPRCTSKRNRNLIIYFFSIGMLNINRITPKTYWLVQMNADPIINPLFQLLRIQYYQLCDRLQARSVNYPSREKVSITFTLTNVQSNHLLKVTQRHELDCLRRSLYHLMRTESDRS